MKDRPLFLNNGSRPDTLACLPTVGKKLRITYLRSILAAECLRIITREFIEGVYKAQLFHQWLVSQQRDRVVITMKCLVSQYTEYLCRFRCLPPSPH